MLTGWGSISPSTLGPLPKDLQYLKLKTITNNECNRLVLNVSKTEVCAFRSPFSGACAVGTNKYIFIIHLQYIFVGRLWRTSCSRRSKSSSWCCVLWNFNMCCWITRCLYKSFCLKRLD